MTPAPFFFNSYNPFVRRPLIITKLFVILIFSLLVYPAMAAVPLTVNLIGLEDPFQKNVLLYLEINKMKDE